MTIKGFIAPLFFGLFLLVGNANALPITLNVGDYSPGTDISHAISGVQLQDYSHTAYANTLTLTDAITPTDNIDFCPPGEPCITTSLSTSIFNDDYYDILNPSNNYPMNTSATDFTGLYLSSAATISTLNFRGFNASGAAYMLFFFDSHQNLVKEDVRYGSYIESCSTILGATYACREFSQAYNLSGLSVHYVAIGGTDRSYLTSLSVGVPEPSSLALLGLGLLGLGTTRRRKAGVKMQ